MRFTIDSAFWRFLDTCVRFAALNLLFLLTAAPMVTLGPARAALYSTVFAYNDHDDINLAREYLRRFKRELPRCLAAWAIFAILIASLAFALAFWNALGTGTSWLALPPLVAAGFILITCCEWWFPLQARYANTFAMTWRNALRLPWACFGATLSLLAIDMTVAVLFVYTTWLRVACVALGCSWLAYAKSLIYLRAFDRVCGNADAMRERPDYSLPTASIT